MIDNTHKAYYALPLKMTDTLRLAIPRDTGLEVGNDFYPTYRNERMTCFYADLNGRFVVASARHCVFYDTKVGQSVTVRLAPMGKCKQVHNHMLTFMDFGPTNTTVIEDRTKNILYYALESGDKYNMFACNLNDTTRHVYYGEVDCLSGNSVIVKNLGGEYIIYNHNLDDMTYIRDNMHKVELSPDTQAIKTDGAHVWSRRQIYHIEGGLLLHTELQVPIAACVESYDDWAELVISTTGEWWSESEGQSGEAVVLRDGYAVGYVQDMGHDYGGAYVLVMYEGDEHIYAVSKDGDKVVQDCGTDVNLDAINMFRPERRVRVKSARS